MNVLIDTNIVLDVWLRREPFWTDSAMLLSLVESRTMTGYLSPTSVTTLHYLAKKTLGERKTRALLTRLLDILTVAEFPSDCFERALNSRLSDFEDAVLESIAAGNAYDWIATRNLKDFKYSTVPAAAPMEIIRSAD